MSFSEIFPLMDDEMILSFRNEASEQDKERLMKMFLIESVHNSREAEHVVATSLFWKPANLGDREFPVPTKEFIFWGSWEGGGIRVLS